MTTVTPMPLAEYPWLIRLFFWRQRRRYGRVLEPGLLWGRSPWVFASVALLYGALDRRSSPLAPALRSLVTVRVSQINHCAFCVDINSATLAQRGVPFEKINALADWPKSCSIRRSGWRSNMRKPSRSMGSTRICVNGSSATGATTPSSS